MPRPVSGSPETPPGGPEESKTGPEQTGSLCGRLVKRLSNAHPLAKLGIGFAALITSPLLLIGGIALGARTIIHKLQGPSNLQANSNAELLGETDQAIRENNEKLTQLGLTPSDVPAYADQVNFKLALFQLDETQQQILEFLHPPVGQSKELREELTNKLRDYVIGNTHDDQKQLYAKLRAKLGSDEKAITVLLKGHSAFKEDLKAVGKVHHLQVKAEKAAKKDPTGAATPAQAVINREKAAIRSRFVKMEIFKGEDKGKIVSGDLDWKVERSAVEMAISFKHERGAVIAGAGQRDYTTDEERQLEHLRNPENEEDPLAYLNEPTNGQFLDPTNSAAQARIRSLDEKQSLEGYPADGNAIIHEDIRRLDYLHQMENGYVYEGSKPYIEEFGSFVQNGIK